VSNLTRAWSRIVSWMRPKPKRPVYFVPMIDTSTSQSRQYFLRKYRNLLHPAIKRRFLAEERWHTLRRQRETK